MHFPHLSQIASRPLLRTLAASCILLLTSCESPPIVPTVGFLWYPVGIITKVEMHQEVGERGLVSGGIGWNQADRGSNGEHDDEQGGGPGLVFGYRHDLGKQLTLEVAAGVAAEINVSTDGEDVGEGAILLIGATLLF